MYLTRTHMQISQIVSELKRTDYRPRMTILASRAALCINDTIKRSSNPKSECAKLSKSDRGCVYRKGYHRLMTNPRFYNELWTLEEVVKLGYEFSACPYFATQGLLKTADIVCKYFFFFNVFLQIHISSSLLTTHSTRSLVHTTTSSTPSCGMP